MTIGKASTSDVRAALDDAADAYEARIADEPQTSQPRSSHESRLPPDGRRALEPRESASRRPRSKSPAAVDRAFSLERPDSTGVPDSRTGSPSQSMTRAESAKTGSSVSGNASILINSAPQWQIQDIDHLLGPSASNEERAKAINYFNSWNGISSHSEFHAFVKALVGPPSNSPDHMLRIIRVLAKVDVQDRQAFFEDAAQIYSPPDGKWPDITDALQFYAALARMPAQQRLRTGQMVKSMASDLRRLNSMMSYLDDVPAAEYPRILEMMEVLHSSNPTAQWQLAPLFVAMASADGPDRERGFQRMHNDLADLCRSPESGFLFSSISKMGEQEYSDFILFARSNISPSATPEAQVRVIHALSRLVPTARNHAARLASELRSDGMGEEGVFRALSELHEQPEGVDYIAIFGGDMYLGLAKIKCSEYERVRGLATDVERLAEWKHKGFEKCFRSAQDISFEAMRGLTHAAGSVDRKGSMRLIAAYDPFKVMAEESDTVYALPEGPIEVTEQQNICIQDSLVTMLTHLFPEEMAADKETSLRTMEFINRHARMDGFVEQPTDSPEFVDLAKLQYSSGHHGCMSWSAWAQYIQNRGELDTIRSLVRDKAIGENNIAWIFSKIANLPDLRTDLPILPADDLRLNHSFRTEAFLLLVPAIDFSKEHFQGAWDRVLKESKSLAGTEEGFVKEALWSVAHRYLGACQQRWDSDNALDSADVAKTFDSILSIIDGLKVSPSRSSGSETSSFRSSYDQPGLPYEQDASLDNIQRMLDALARQIDRLPSTARNTMNNRIDQARRQFEIV